MTERTHSRRRADGHGHDEGHGHAGGRHRHGRHGQPQKGPPWLKWVLGCVLAFAALLFFINITGGGSAHQEADAPHHIAKAEKSLAEGQFVRALDDCAQAKLANPDAATLARIDALEKQIKEKQARADDKPKLELAERSIAAIREMNRQCPAADRQRPATRALANLCKNWLELYRDVAKKYEDTAVLAVEVQTLFDTIAPTAMLSQPDDAGDVLFAAERRLTLTAPVYGEILKTVDDYMAAHPQDARIAELRKSRGAIETAAQAAFDRYAAEATQHAAAGRFDEARKSEQAMRNAIVNPPMALRATAVGKEINKLAGKK